MMATNVTPVDSLGDDALRPRTSERVPIEDTGLTDREIVANEVTPEQIEAVIGVLGRAFNGDPSWFASTDDPRDHLRWKTVGRPGGGAIRLTEQGDRVVGVSVSGVQYYMLRGVRTLARQGFDAALDLDFQGRGVQSARRRLRDAGQRQSFGAFSVGAAAHPTSRLRRGVRTDGAALANEIDALARPLGVRGILRRRGGPQQMGQGRTRVAMESTDGRLARRTQLLERMRLGARLARSLVLRRPRAHNAPWTIRTIERFDERADELFADASPQFDLIQVRDQRYLNWRFCDPRGGAFVVRVAEQEGQLLGYVAIRMRDGAAVLADTLVLPGREDVLASLLDDAARLAKSAGASYMRVWCAHHHPYRSTLEARGFVQHLSTVTFGLRPIVARDAVMSIALDPQARVHLMVADTDHV